ncbi:hypothetical protein PBI_MRMAGOO_47 [Mycobacterium phage MrMagoo]|uniref:Uncharacterized protein n=1 Tax=Mycobacterium phage MrMagoo TaxID=1927020 RepID=A0A1L6BYT6_9CAUD|nr:hypothetical protein J4U04_gp047 [Mycobacterium phage MrMagoo]APQ42258.1 hypothetical protein PBI_MRMAGOO_47 [Mycobacterium phage MrMagoo]ARM70227.1 hypothetical protein SEA_GARDENSALSA_47 [Mycobacterium phage GardenSalsa]
MSGFHGIPVAGCYTVCEECWAKAFVIARTSGKHQAEVYRELVKQTWEEAHGVRE